MAGINKKPVIFIDSGDTIIDESTEVRDYTNKLYSEGIVVCAEAIPGMLPALRQLHDDGYTLILVADGYWASFKNMFARLGITDCFYSFVTSECVGASKPDSRMFTTALGAAGLTPADAGQVVMIGNNLARDIKGANAAGITSVHFDWSPRYSKIPSDLSEVPDYTVHSADDIVNLVKNLDETV